MKLFKIILLFLVGAFTIKSAAGQANASINVLTQNSGQVFLGGQVFVQVDIGNTGPTSSIGIYKVRAQISIPTAIASVAATGSVLPSGWTITSQSAGVINLSNGTDIIPVNASRTILIAVNGNTLGGPSTVAGVLSFSNGVAPGTGPGTLAGDNTADNTSQSSLQVIPAPLCTIAVSAAAGNVCNGGTTTLTATATGASGSVEYSLNGGAFQAGNTFTVNAGSSNIVVAREVSNPTCTATAATVNVPNPAAITASAAAGIIACNGGTTTLTVTATGGTGALQYSLDGIAFQAGNTFTVPVGSYTVTVRDANLCTASTNTVSVTAPAAITASAAAGTITCNGGSTTLTVTATGGTGTLQYSLNGGAFQGANTFTVNAAGSPYTVTVRDANLCTGTTSAVSVSQPSAILVSGSVTTPIVIFGGTGTITVTATGGTGAKTYVIASGTTINTTGATTGVFTGLAAGSYTFTATDANLCSVTSAAVSLTQPGALVATATSTLLSCASTATITVTASGGTAPYTVTGPGGPLNIPTSGGSVNIPVTAAGTYNYVITDATSATTPASVTILPAVGCTTIYIADPAVGQMNFTTLGNFAQSANTLLFTQNYKLRIPFYNLNQLNIVPNGTIKMTVDLGTKLVVSPTFTLASAPLNTYFAWTQATVAGHVIITGTQIADIPADFAGTAVFEVKGSLSCTSTISTNIVIVNTLATLSDEDLQNNAATLQYTLPVTVTTTQVNVTCNGANNGIINVISSPGTTVVIRNALNVVVGNTNLAPGVYTVTATALGDTPIPGNTCTNSTLVNIVQPNVLSATVFSTVNNACHGGNNGTITVTTIGGTAPYHYTIAGPTVNATGFFTGIFTGLTAGAYTITATDANGCTSVTTTTITEPTGTAPNLSLGSDITGSFFAAVGNTQTIVYNISEIAGNPAVGDTLRLTRVSGFTINFNPGLFSTVVGTSTYTLDNSRWKIDNTDPSFVSIILTDPSNPANAGTLSCLQSVNVAVSLTRNTQDVSTFTLSARLRKANGELVLGNNLNSIVLTAE